ncbi:hypothetical protein EB796_018703 [Bugula neritina]|uniref:Helicase ATP-binding domain-containing protein n=1 Tax=Bugula neritina TaxID=10212 RepID=A0A7J7JCC4_BUGNE|nr:hypothetical protein EB796_018703 [Bugula neritina]
MAVEEEENKENAMPAVDVPSVAPQDDLPTLMAKAKEFIAEQDVESALRCYEKAYSIEPSEKIARRLERMRAYLETEPEAKPGEEKLEMHTAPPRPRDTIASRTTASPASSMGGVLPSLNSDIGMSDEDVAIYNSLISQAKNVLRCGDFEEALGLYEKAHMLHPSDKLASKIAKLKSVSSQLSPETEVTGTSTSPNPAKVDEAAIDAHYSELTAKARKLIEQEKLEEALVLFKDAYGVKPSDKLERRIQRIEQYLQQQTQTNQGVSQTTPDEPESADLYNQLITKGKEFISQNKVAEALKMYQEAAEIRPSEKLSNRITKCQDYLSQCGDEDGDFTHVGNGFYLHQDLYTKLYPHQKEGLLWFWGLHKKRTGGILADDMGLGKTIQVISFLSGLFDAEELKTVIIVMPLSLIENWKREFEKWAPGILLQTYHGGSLRERARSVAKVQRRGGVLLTSYGMIVSAAELLAKKDGESFGRDFSYDYVILDEGHKIKNPTKTSKGVHMIAAKHRIILTGTPIQNNLKEMWALFDWTHHGMLLGTARTFHSEYSKPITRAREKCATYGERRLGEQMAESLKKIISPLPSAQN